MTLNKITSKSIETGAITADDLHTTLDFSTKTFTMHNNHITETMVTQHSAPIIAQITDSAPATLDTLNELAAALGDDPNFATTTANNIALKAPLADPEFTGHVGINFSNPSSTGSRLVVLGDAGSNALFVKGNTGSGTSWGLGVNAGSTSADASFRVYDKDGSASYVYVRGDGNVGFGTEAPSAPIDVITNSIVYAAEFRQLKTTDGDGVIIEIGSTASADYALTVRSDAGATSVLAAKADGKVGIGTFLPDYALDVRGGDSTSNGARIKTGDNGYDGLIVSNSSILKCYPAAGQSVSLQAYNSSGSVKTGVKVTGSDTPEGDISTKLESVTELLGHNVYDNGNYGTSSDQYVDLEDWSPADFRILEIFGTANPNSGGSGSYADPVHMYIYNGSGWNGAEVTYYVYGKSVAPLARDMYGSGSGSSANVAEVWWYNSSTTAQQDAATHSTASGYHLRLKFPNTNTNTTMISLKVIKRA